MNKKYVLIKGREGFGNRILSLLTGILYANLTNRRYYVDWRDDTYSDDGSNVFHKFFETPFFNLKDILPKTNLIYPKVWIKKLDKSAIEVCEFLKSQRPRFSSTDLRHIKHDEDILVVWMYTPELYLLRRHLKGNFRYLESQKEHEIFREVYKKNLFLKPAIQKRVDDFKKIKFREKKIIGVHVRYTDKKIQLRKVEKIIDKILKKENDAKIFLTTDNLKVIDFFKNKGLEVITTEKWFPKNGMSLHQNLDCPSRLQNGIEALIDMNLFANCDYLVYASNSTFAYVASFISDAPEKHKFNIYKKKLKEYIPKVIRRSLWDFFENFHGVPHD